MLYHHIHLLVCLLSVMLSATFCKTDLCHTVQVGVCVSPRVCLLHSVVTVEPGFWEALVSSGCH